MRLWRWGAVALVAAWVAGCGGNSTTVGVLINPSTAQTVLLNGTDQFTARGSGASTTIVFWQICLPPATSTNQPTNCTPGVGPAQCSIPTVSSPLTGFGTITGAGLYAAPGVLPSPNSFLIMASSCVKPTAFATVGISIDSGIRVQLTPTSATIGTGEMFQFTATVSGTLNKALTWLVNGNVGGDAQDGFISTTGNYTAPPTATSGTVTIAAQSAADSSKQGQAIVHVFAAVDPTVASIDPSTAAQGSAQQDIYVTGTDFFSTSQIVVNMLPGISDTPVPTTFINAQLLRAVIPASLLQQQGTLNIKVVRQNGDPDPQGTFPLTLQIVRPAVIASSLDSVSPVGADVALTLTGGFFSPGGNTPGATNATFNGGALNTTVVDSRHISFTVPGGGLTIPGLYPITVQNNGNAAISGVNIAVQPDPIDIQTSPLANVGVGTSPSAVAIDPALGLAVVTNTGSNSVTLLDLATQATTAIPVGLGPIGVAIDDQLPDHLALVVNSTDQTISVIDLSLQTVVGQPLPLSIGPKATSPVPFSIGINSQTHRGIVTYQSTNQALVIDLVNANPLFSPACFTPPCPVSLVGGSVSAGLPAYGTGVNPAVAIDPHLNWAIVTPGGAGNINFVDLGRADVPASGLNPEVFARTPSLVGVFQFTSSMRGIGLNTETHEVLFTDPNGTNLIAFSLLDNTVSAITFTLNGVALNKPNYVAAGVNPLANTGIAVNSDGTGVIVDVAGGNVLKTITLGASPQAVAIDPATNRAVVVNQGTNNVSIVSLGSVFRTLQIAEINPAIAFVTNPATNLLLTINGTGFIGGQAQVLLDGTALPGTVTNSGRTVTVAVPSSMVATAHRYAVTVQNLGSTSTSNVADLAIIQPVRVGHLPFGVAVDTDRDIAAVTNSGDNTVSLVNLLTGGPINLLSPLRTGATPEGVAVIPRLGLAVAANFGSNSITVLDDTGNTTNAITTQSCGTICSQPTGVATDQDHNKAAITGSGTNTVSFVGTLTTTGSIGAANISSPAVNADPTAVAIDPDEDFNYAAVATSSQFSSLDLINVATGALVNRINGLQVPSGVVFDPLNKVFLAANSLLNNISIVDPATFIQTIVRVGINPTSIDYNFQASTLVTFNSASKTLSVLDYVCPPTANNAANCEGPRAREILALGGSPQFSIAVDPKLNLVVVVDQANDRVLLVPLPH